MLSSIAGKNEVTRDLSFQMAYHCNLDNFFIHEHGLTIAEVWRLVTFVVTIYTCLWFDCKLNWRATDAPKIIFKAMKLMMALPEKKCQ